MPGAGNPQNWNRYAYVGNSPINLSDPTGHFACEDSSAGGCLSESQATKLWDDTHGIYNKPGKKKNGSKKDQNDENTSTPEKNICKGQPPYIPSYDCSLIFTDPGYMVATPPQDIVVGSDDFTDFEWLGKTAWVNGVPVINITTSGSRAWDLAGAFVDATNWVGTNTTLFSHWSGQYAQAGIALVHHNASGTNFIPGYLVSNQTGGYLNIKSVTISGVRTQHESPIIPNDFTGVVHTEIYRAPNFGDISIRINYEVIQITNNDAYIFGSGSIRYDGPIEFP